MSVGKNIRTYRLEKNMTQKDLSEELYVTAQAISRWENDEVEPGIEMIKKIAEILEVSVEDVILGRKDKEEERESAEVIEKEEVTAVSSEPVPVVAAGPVVEVDKRPILAQCSVCRKPIYQGDHIHYPFTRGSARTRHTDLSRPFCHSCEVKRVAKAKKQREQYVRSEARKFRIHGLVWGILAALIFAAILIGVMINEPSDKLVQYLLITIFGTYGVFALVFCLIVPNSIVSDVFYGISKFSIRMPGLIFTLDLEGIFWLITVKLTLMLISFLISAVAFIIAAIVSGSLAMFVFPFALRKSIKQPEESIWG